MDKGCIMEKETKREGKNCYFFRIFMGWVSCFYFCNNSFFITGNAPLILKIFSNKTNFVSYTQFAFSLLCAFIYNFIIDFAELHLSSQFSFIDLFLSLLRES